MEHPQYEIPLKSLEQIYSSGEHLKVRIWFVGFMLFLVAVMFLPWTQNIKAKGNITTLYQEQRPQEIHSPIPGRIARWSVKEGDFVKKGDTLLQISEIKEDYLDPNLIDRTKQQVEAKKGTIQYYKQKAGTSDFQIQALNMSKKLKIDQLNNKLKQLDNKLTGERAELDAVTNEFELAKNQYERQQKMFEEGLVSQTQLQQRNLAFQNALAKRVMVDNKLPKLQAGGNQYSD